MKAMITHFNALLMCTRDSLERDLYLLSGSAVCVILLDLFLEVKCVLAVRLCFTGLLGVWEEKYYGRKMWGKGINSVSHKPVIWDPW